MDPRKKCSQDFVVGYAGAGNWGAVVELAPERPDGWIQRSYALHELKSTQEAFENLLPVADRFPGVWTIPYNLSCYCGQLGRLDECQGWFKKAMAVDEE